MLKRATEKDREAILAYIDDRPCENLFIAGDILLYGFDSDFQKVWIEDDMRCIYLLYKTNLCVYSKDKDHDYRAIVEIIQNHEVRHINAIRAIADKIKLIVKPKKISHTKMAICEGPEHLKDHHDVMIADDTDLDGLADLAWEVFGTAEGYVSLKEVKESLKGIMQDFPIYMLKEDGRIVSMAYANAKSAKAGMICGVATAGSHRAKGYASACVSACVADLLNEGRIACLFFDNPKAASVYYRLGFKDIGDYTLLLL